MSLDINNLILAGVVTHLLAGLGKALFKAPKQQAQIDSIEGKVDAVIGQVAALVPQRPSPPAQRPSPPAPLPILGEGSQSPPAPNDGGAGEKTNAQGGQ